MDDITNHEWYMINEIQNWMNVTQYKNTHSLSLYISHALIWISQPNTSDLRTAQYGPGYFTSPNTGKLCQLHVRYVKLFWETSETCVSEFLCSQKPGSSWVKTLGFWNDVWVEGWMCNPWSLTAFLPSSTSSNTGLIFVFSDLCLACRCRLHSKNTALFVSAVVFVFLASFVRYIPSAFAKSPTLLSQAPS